MEEGFTKIFRQWTVRNEMRFFITSLDTKICIQIENIVTYKKCTNT